MSIFFVDTSGADLWNPGNRSAHLYLGSARSAAKEIGTPSGLGPVVADEVVIDREQFASFVDALGTMPCAAGTESPVWALLSGCYSISSVLLVRLKARPPSQPLLFGLCQSGATIVGP